MKQSPPESVTAPWAPAGAQKRLVELEERFGERAPGEIPETVRTILQTQSEEVDDRDLVLYAGTNAASPLVRRFLGSSIETRSSMGYPGDKYQAYLVEHVEELEVLTTDLSGGPSVPGTPRFASRAAPWPTWQSTRRSPTPGTP